MVDLSGAKACHCLASRRSSRYLSRLYDRHLAPSGLSISQFSILVIVQGRPEITVAELAAAMVMERTTLVRALRPLQEAGLIISERADRSNHHVLTVSRQGRRKITEAAPFWEAAQQEFECVYGHSSAMRLRSASSRVAENG